MWYIVLHGIVPVVVGLAGIMLSGMIITGGVALTREIIHSIQCKRRTNAMELAHLDGRAWNAQVRLLEAKENDTHYYE